MTLIPIPIGYEYRCTVRGGTYQIVQCERCRHVYVYLMTRTGMGWAANILFSNPEAESSAGTTALVELQKKLHRDSDAVPCPECGTYQTEMVEALRLERCRKLTLAAKVTLVTALILAMLCAVYLMLQLQIAWLFGSLAVVLAWGGGVLVCIARYQLQAYDPNKTELQERLRIGGKAAVSLDEFRGRLERMGIAAKFPIGS
jgi:hypothetical protein